MLLVDFEFNHVIERRVICGNQKSVVKCNKIAWELLQFHNVPQRFKSLEDAFYSTDSDW